MKLFPHRAAVHTIRLLCQLALAWLLMGVGAGIPLTAAWAVSDAQQRLFFDQRDAVLATAPGAVSQAQAAAYAPSARMPATLAPRTQALTPVRRVQQPVQLVLEPVSSQKLAAESLNQSAKAGIPLKIGFSREVPMLASHSQTDAQLRWTATATGQVAAISLRSPSAVGLRLGLLIENLPDAALLRFYAQAGGPVHQVTGLEIMQLLARNLDAGDHTDAARTYWSPAIDGQEITLEIELPIGVSGHEVLFSVPQVSHWFALPLDTTALVKSIGSSASCEVDAMCSQASWSVESLATAKMSFVKAGGSYICTGTAINDSDSSSFIPYFLSANHCISTQTVASTLNTYWFYRAASCNSASLSGSMKTLTSGATLLYASLATDTSFMRLNSALPTGANLAGWTANLPALGTAVTGIHNPDGDLQKISFGSVSDYEDCTPPDADGSFSCQSATSASADHLAVEWSQGITEGGSSGSGLWMVSGSSHYLVGQLHGGSSACYGSGSDEYGRFDVAYKAALSTWLGSSTPATTPVCSLTAVPASIAPGASATLTASCSPAATAYVWSGGTCAGRTTATCTVTPATTTSYTVAGSNASGTGSSASATVTVTTGSTPAGYASAAKMVGGLWTFLETMGSTVFTDTYTFTSVDTTPDSYGEYNYYGKNKYGYSVSGWYDNSLSKLVLWDDISSTSSYSNYFEFSFIDDNHVSGCYYFVSVSATTLGTCYVMTGSRPGAVPLQPVSTVSPGALAFTAQTVGSSSAAQTVTLSNTGTAALNIASIVSHSDFAYTSTCGTLLAAGANCLISVTFTPTSAGTYVTTLVINSNASSSPQSISLSGTGVASPTIPTSLTTAKVYLGPNDNFTISDSGTTLFGSNGADVVTLTASATGVVLDQNVDRISFANAVASYTFKQTGNKINVYDASGVTLLASLPVQGDADGTVLSFSDGSASAKQSAGVMTLGGASISSSTPGAVTPTLTGNPATPSALSTAQVYLGQNDSFTLNSSGTTLYGNTGIDKVTLAAGVSRTVLDQNVDEVVFLNASGSYSFRQTGNKIHVYDATGSTLLTSLPVQGDADGTVLRFSDGPASAKLIAGVMTLGLATVSNTVATPLKPFAAASAQQHQ